MNQISPRSQPPSQISPRSQPPSQISPRGSRGAILPPIRNEKFSQVLAENHQKSDLVTVIDLDHVTDMKSSRDHVIDLPGDDQITYHPPQIETFKRNGVPFSNQNYPSSPKQNPASPNVTRLFQWDRVPPLGAHTPPTSLAYSGNESPVGEQQLFHALPQQLSPNGGKRRRVQGEEAWHSVVLTYNNREEDVTNLR